MTRHCLVCGKDWGPNYTACCAEGSLVAVASRGFLKKKKVYFALDGKSLTVKELEQMRRFAKAKHEELLASGTKLQKAKAGSKVEMNRPTPGAVMPQPATSPVELSHSGKCDVCGVTTEWAKGNALTTRQVMLEGGYWNFLFRNQRHIFGVGDLKMQSQLLGAFIRQHAASGTGWLVCEACSQMFKFDKTVAREYAVKRQSPTGSGPVNFNEVLPVAMAAKALGMGFFQNQGQQTAVAPVKIAAQQPERSLTRKGSEGAMEWYDAVRARSPNMVVIFLKFASGDSIESFFAARSFARPSEDGSGEFPVMPYHINVIHGLAQTDGTVGACVAGELSSVEIGEILSAARQASVAIVKCEGITKVAEFQISAAQVGGKIPNP